MKKVLRSRLSTEVANLVAYLYLVLRTLAQITEAATKFSLVNILVKIPIERFFLNGVQS